MIFTVFDAWLSQSLHRWEVAEYASEAFVILACIGELVADFGEQWLGEERKKHVERRSTILLVAALSVALICLAKTNHLSGNAIGSLGEEAEEADKKAKIAVTDSSNALSQAKDAITKAAASEASLGRAESDANNAQAAARNALALARGARQEADSFEREIRSAKAAASQASEKVADRVLTPAQQADIASTLSKFGARKIKVIIVGSTGEISRITQAMLTAVKQAGWTIGNSGNAMGGNASGVFVGTHIGSDGNTNAAAAALLSVLHEAGIAVGLIPQYDDQLPIAMIGNWDTKATAPIRIIIGSKP
jgi:hypothetical protein